jgi:hypothetical protein
VAGVPTQVSPPVDWSYDPIGSSVYRRALPDLLWLDPLFYAFANGHDVGALNQAKAILLDFASTHRHVDHHDKDAWERKRAGDRLIRIVYTLRASTCAGTLGRYQAKQLLTSARLHARFLAATPNSPLRSNHDLFQALGLMAIGRYLPFLGSARTWYRDGDRRFRSGIAALVDERTGVHLEHTASYQAVSIERVESYLGLATNPPKKMARLLVKMKAVASWFTMPDGTFAPLGDTPFTYPAPGYALAGSPQDRGLSPTRVSGFEMVKEPGSYLATTAGYHRPSHKQADELSFDLYEAGHRVVMDSGRDDPGRGPPGAKQYTLSSRAHSTLTVDGKSFPLDGDFYGSALDAKGEGHGWFAIEGHNPLLAPQHVKHHRLFLYKPGVALVIVDDLQSKQPHGYQRYVQIAPDLKASLNANGLVSLSSKDGFAGTVWSAGATRGVSVRLLRGRAHPLRGWYAPPGISRLRPRYAVELRSHSRSAKLVTTVGIGPRPVRARPVPGGAIVKVPGQAGLRIHVARHGDRLHVAAGPAAD